MLHKYSIVCLLTLAVSGQDFSGKTIRTRPYYTSDAEDSSQDLLYKPTRRSERVPSYQYETDNKPDIEYAYPARYETEQAEYALQRNPTQPKDYDQLIKSQYQLRQQQPNVEQYLKEVTPTTKTAYNQRNYQREGIKNREQTRPPVRYVLQNEQRQPSQANYQYHQNPEQLKAYQRQYELQGPSANAVYQNPPRVEEAEEPSKSQIYVTQHIAKKPTKVKQPKTKPSDSQPNIEYYRQLQVYHQQRQQQLEQLQQIQQNKPNFEPSHLEYQEEPQSYPDHSSQQAKRPGGPVRYQLEQPQHESPEQIEYQRPQEYQQKPKQHPKYLPEPKTRYQTSPIEEPTPTDEALAKYQASIKKYHQARYQPQEIRYQPPSKYQYSEESQPVPQYKDFDGVLYERPQSIRNRPETRYKQYLQGPNVRYVDRPPSYSLSE